MARCSDTSSAVVESFDCSVIYLNHIVMSFNDDYAGSNDEGGAGCVLKHRPKQTNKQKKYDAQKSAGGMSDSHSLKHRNLQIKTSQDLLSSKMWEYFCGETLDSILSMQGQKKQSTDWCPSH